MQSLIQRISDIKKEEMSATLLAFSFVFLLMASYYILRPVRDAMASDWTDSEISFLWTLNFFISAIAVFIYGWIISKIRFKHVVPGVYIFFGLSFVSLYLIEILGIEFQWINKFFYIWVSFFSMFHLSVFWSYMSDIFNKTQAKRLFAIIASGASAGALVGPLLPTFLASFLSSSQLTFIASILLFLTFPIISKLDSLKESKLENKGQVGDKNIFHLKGNPIDGFKSFIANPYLLGIGAFILLYTMISTFIYFEQTEILRGFERAERTQILGSIDLLVNILTFAIAFFATGRIANKFGVGITLALLPFFVAFGIIILAFAPIITVLLALQVARRAGNYAITRPAREMLFTEVSQEERYKAKPVIDVVVYRGGDTVTAWFFTALTEGLGLAFSVIGIIGAFIALLWGLLGLKLGKSYEARNQ
ncbi:MAG: NTP/NDP exchange transporter [Gammaproteobacteria bacterium]